MGVQFYEDFYYNQIGKNETERKVFLEKYKDIGIKVSLDNMLRSKKQKLRMKITLLLIKKLMKNVIKILQW